MLSEFFLQVASPFSKRIDCIVDSDLAIFVVEPGIDILSAFPENFLTKHHRLCGSIDEEVIIRDFRASWKCGAAVVSEMKDPSLYTKPVDISYKL